MINTKKLISISSIMLLAGIFFTASSSALSMPSGSEWETSPTDNQQDPYTQCLAYVKLKNLTWVDCKAKAEAMRQENKEGRSHMNQEIKDEKMKMHQNIKDEKMKMKEENKQNRQMMGSWMKQDCFAPGSCGQGVPPSPVGELKNFLRNPLTSEEQETLKILLQTQQTDREAIMKDITITPEEKAVKIQALMTAHMTALLAFVSTEKQESFKKMMEEKLAMMKKNQGNRQEFRDGAKDQYKEFKEGAKEKRQEFQDSVKAKKQALSEKNKTLLTKAVASLPLERLQAILVKVDKALSVSKKEKVIAQLNEIADIVQDKIDELTGTSSEDGIVEDILGTATIASPVETTETGTNSMTQ